MLCDMVRVVGSVADVINTVLALSSRVAHISNEHI